MFKKYQFPILFLALFLVFEFIYWVMPAAIAHDFFVNQCTVKPSATLIQWLSSEGTVVKAEGNSIVSPQAKINVLRGCEGTEALFLLFAAILACRAPLKKTLIGLVAGTAVIFVVNQVRIVALYFISYMKPTWFEAIHGTIAPLIIVGIAWLFFSKWLGSNNTLLKQEPNDHA